MSENNSPPERSELQNRTVRMVIAGTVLIGMALMGIVWASFLPAPDRTGDANTPAPIETGQGDTMLSAPTEDGVQGIAIERSIGSLMTPLPSLTPTITPTAIPSNTPPPSHTPPATATSTEPTAIAPPAATPEPVFWTDEEKNALSWLCYGEVGGMGAQKIDACYSVLSTVRARYAYPNSFPESDVLGTLARPGQFNVTVYTDRPGPDPDLMWAVEQYMAGARGSCNGYLFFDSVPGGPSLCQIWSAYGWIEFHNGWN